MIAAAALVISGAAPVLVAPDPGGAGPPGRSLQTGVPASPDPGGVVLGPVLLGPVAPTQRTTLRVVAAGDLLVPPLLTEQAAADAEAAGLPGHDFTRILSAVRPVIEGADLAICHLEQPLAEPEGPFPHFPYFAAPPQLADAIAATGFDTCSTASNHALDSGLPGITRTLDHLDRVGVAHAGTARDAREAATPTVVEVGGVRVGHLSYTFSLNGIPLPEGSPWAANLIDVEAILAEAGRARSAGAEIIILSLHWGTEYQVAADIGQLGLADRLLPAGDIDLIIGHHAHVVQPFERIGHEWVAYGLGNLLTRFPDGSRENTQDSVLPRFTFERTSSGRWQVSAVEVVAAWMEYEPAARVIDLQAALADPDLAGDRRARYDRALARITEQVMARGAEVAGLRMAGPPSPPRPTPAPAVW